MAMKPPVRLACERNVCACAAAVLAALFSMLPSLAHAGTPMGDVLCYVLFDILRGSAAPGLASIAVSAVGVAAAMGKASWGLAMTVAVGIGAVIGCANIVWYLGMGTVSC